MQPIGAAVVNGHVDVMDIILPYAVSAGVELQRPLELVARRKQTEIVLRLLPHVREVGKALVDVAGYGFVDVVDVLLPQAERMEVEAAIEAASGCGQWQVASSLRRWGEPSGWRGLIVDFTRRLRSSKKGRGKS